MLTLLAALLVIDSARDQKLTAYDRQRQSQSASAAVAMLAAVAFVWPFAIARVSPRHAAAAYTTGALVFFLLTPITYLAVGCLVAIAALVAASTVSSRES